MQKVFWLVQPGDSEAIFWIRAEAGKTAELHKTLRAKLAQIKGVSSRVGGLLSPLFPWPSEGAQVVVRLRGKDLTTLQNTAKLLRKRLSKTAGIVDIDHFPSMGKIATIEIDREKTGLSGAKLRDVAQALTINADKVEWSLSGRPWHITVKVPKADDKPPKPDITEVKILPLTTINPLVNLMIRDVAAVKVANAPIGSIPHEDGRACVILTANLEGRTLKEVATDIRRFSRELAEKGVVIEIEGAK